MKTSFHLLFASNPTAMLKKTQWDAVVIGAGPNGLAAAITLARAGRSVLLIEGHETVGGGCRSAELTLPGFTHDVCSAIHPLGVSSPFFRTVPLTDFGLEWVYPPSALAHPLDDGTAVIVGRSVEETSRTLGPDAGAYRRLMGPVVRQWDRLLPDLLGPLPLPPKHPVTLAQFGLRAVWPMKSLARAMFRNQRASAVLAGTAGHSMMTFDHLLTSAFGIMLAASAHAVGWPMARGGSQKIADALAGYFRSLGGEIVTGWQVEDVDELPERRVLLLDLTPRHIARIAGSRLPPGYRQTLEGYRYGPGVFKLDWALDAPIPWRAAGCDQAGTVHLGGTLEEIAKAEGAVWNGEHAERPYVLLAQQSRFDPTRAPEGKHTAWAYCHVPSGSTFDMSERIEAQVERFAPGFRDRILARSKRTAADLEAYNPNYVGGDINSGVQDYRQHFTRPAARRVPYSTPARDIYICSSATPPGGGVHGMCGYHAARAALRAVFDPGA